MGHSLIGTRLAHYELLGALGTGAMSEVYLGRDTRLDKEVAVKVINDSLAKRKDLVERFEREARAASRLEHPNVATIFFSGMHEAKRFYAMELVRGWSLNDVIEAHVSVTWDQLLSVFAQACVGLGAAQDAGVIHRDIKPGNLMVADDGNLKIVDFGLARLGEDKNLSRAGAMMGTPFYIAPEMVQGRGGDHLSDIYSLGVTLFHAVAGQPPFDAETPYGVMMQHISEVVPMLDDYNPGVPEALARLVAAMMSKSPAARPPSYHRVHLTLRKIAASLPRERLDSKLQWCGIDKVNTTPDGARCTVCGKPYGLRERAESYHVDLVNWNRTGARGEVAAYIAEAVGQDADDVELLLDPLPFRAAFRVPRDRAKRMHRKFHDLGAIVELVPSDDDVMNLDIKELPITPRWPTEGSTAGDSSANWEADHTSPGFRAVAPSSPGDHWKVISGILAVAVVLLLVLLSRQPTVVYLPAPAEAPPRITTEDPGSVEAAQASPRTAQDVPVVTPEVASAEQPTPGETPESVRENRSAPPTPTVSSAWFTVDAGSTDPVVAERIIDALEAAAVHVADGLPLDRAEPIRVELTSDALQEHWRSAAFEPTIEFPAGGVTSEGHPALEPAAKRLVARAAVHRLGGDDTPPWLLVGLAGYLAEGPLQESDWPALVSAAGLPTEVEVGVGANPEPVERLLRGFASFVLRSRGEVRMNKTLELMREGRTIDDAALRALGTTPSDLEQEWIGLSGGVD